MTNTEIDIVDNQLQGIMDCSEIIRIACLLDMPKFCKIQKQRLKTLLYIQNKTNCMMIKKYNAIQEITADYPKITEYPIAKPESTEEQKSILTKVFSAWIKWCNASIALYETMEGSFWKNLLVLHKQDLKYAQKWAEHFQITIPISVRERLQQKLNKE